MGTSATQGRKPKTGSRDMTASRNEANFFAIFRTLGQTPQVDIVLEGGVEYAASMSVPWPRGVFAADPGRQPVNELVGRVAVAIRAGTCPNLWIVSPGNCPATLPHALGEHGFAETAAWPAMRMDTSRFPAATDSGPLRISAIRDESRLGRFAEIVLRRPPGDAQAATFARMFAAARARNPQAFRFFLGDVDGRSVAASMLFRSGDAAGIYWVATLPEHRRAGFGTAMTRHAAAEAFDAGAAACVLHATRMGESIYRRLGFETVFTYRAYALPDPAVS